MTFHEPPVTAAAAAVTAAAAARVLSLALAGACALALSFATASCGPVDAESGAVVDKTEHYAGAVEGSDAKLGVAVDAGRALVFLCGGPTDPSDTVWITAAVDGQGKLTTSGQGPVIVSASIVAGVVEGTIVRAKGLSRFRAPRVTELPTGLWEAREPEGRVGLVVLTPGDDGEAQGVLLGPSRAFQVTPVRPLQTLDGRLRVSVPDLGQTFALRRAIP